MSLSVRWTGGLLGVVAIVSCAAAERDPPSLDASAEAHRREAEAHAATAREHKERYDPRGGAPDYRTYHGMEPNTPTYGTWDGYDDLEDDFYWDMQQYNPSAVHLLRSEDHRRQEREHLAAAKALESYEERQCKAFPRETRAMCPLLGQVAAVEDVEGGVRIRFHERVDVNAVMAHVRCHLGFAQARGRVGMDQCPLYLDGVRAQRVPRSRDIDLISDGEAGLEELRRRTRAHVGSRGAGQ